jgi:hypothetical protein
MNFCVTEALNPYAAPRAERGDGAAPDYAWRIEGRLLHARKGATLPPICIYTGAPAAGGHVRRELSWTPAWFKALVVVIPIIAVFAYSMMRRSGELEYALGPEARKRRRSGIAIGLLGCAAAFALFLLAASNEQPLVALGAVALFIAAVLVARARARVFRVVLIDERYLHVLLTLPAAQALAAAQTP